MNGPNNRVIIRRATIRDFYPVLKVEQEGFGPILANPLEISADFILSDVYVLEYYQGRKKDTIAAIFLLRVGPVAYIFNGSVRKKYRRKHIATDFLPKVITKMYKDGIRYLVVMIEEDNKASVAVCKRAGFRQIGKIFLPLHGWVYVLGLKIDGAQWLK
jgi:ribosomal protein S18 acetylase RimI-like enzyme